MLARLWRRRWICLALLLVGVLGGAGYLLMTPKVFAAEAQVRFRSGAGAPPGEWLFAETAGLRSLQTLDGAAGKLGLRRAWLAGDDRPDPLALLAERVKVSSDARTGEVWVTALGDSPNAAEALGNAVVQAYLEHRSAAAAQRMARAQADAAAIAAAKTAAEQLAQRQDDYDRFILANPNFASPESAQAASDQIAKLTDALTAAEAESAAARGELEAAGPLMDDPSRAAEVAAAFRSRGLFGPLDAQTDDLQSQIAPLRKQLELDRQSLGANNPRIRATQSKIKILEERVAEIDQRKVGILRTSLEERAKSTAAHVDALQRTLQQQRQQLGDAVARSAQFKRLLGALEESKKAAAEGSTSADDGPAPAAAPLAVEVVRQAVAEPTPRRPSLGRGVILGLLTGVAMALLVAIWPADHPSQPIQPQRVVVRTIARRSDEP